MKTLHAGVAPSGVGPQVVGTTRLGKVSPGSGIETAAARDRRMIVNLNGWPGVGKLTIARELSALIGGRLLDNHTILNVGSAVAAQGSPDFYATVRAVRAATFDAILRLPVELPVIMTNVVARGGTSGFLEENWMSILALAKARSCDLYSVTLTCAPAENARRIASADRASAGKMQDAGALAELTRTRVLFDDGATFRLTLDTSALSPPEAARRIADWLRGIVSSKP